MKKFFTLFAATLVSMTMMAETIFSFTVTNPASGTYDAVGGTAKCTTAMASGGNNEITIGEQTFYKFNSSSAWEFTLADDGKFAEGDVISITAACQAGSDKSGKGVKLNDIAVTGDFPKGESNTISYTVQAGDAIDGQATITVKRNDSDIKFGTISVERENVTPSTDPVTTAEINGANACIVGNSVELVCTAPKATEYQWSLNGTAIEGANKKKYTFTPTAEGEYSFTCLASNDYTATPVMADAFVVTVVDPAKATGEIIKATLTSGTAANVTGIVGGTADVNLSSSKKLDKGKYFGIQLAAGNFKEGDTVIIVMSKAGTNYPCLFADKDRTNCLFVDTDASSDLEYRIILPAAANNTNTLYLSRDADDADGYKWNPTLTSIAVVRPMPETSRVEELTGAKIADYTLTESNLSALKYNKYIKIGEDYVAAPVVVFTKTITITYEDNSTKEVTEDIKVTATADGNLWKAYATIAGEEYTIAANKAASFTVTYMYGKNVLGTEMVAVGAEPKEYERYQTMTLATFAGWYRDEDLTTPVSLPMAITQDFTFYANFTKTYIHESVNIEQLVLDNGTKYDIQSALTAAGWAYENLNDLDTLNDLEKKDNRNYAFLGLKMKTAGAYIQGWLKVDDKLFVRFGNIGCDIKVSLKGATFNVDNTFTKDQLTGIDLGVFGHPEDILVTISTTNGSTVVLKQLMLNTNAKDVTLPDPGAYLVTCEANENGKVEAAWPNKKYRTPVGETVTITATPNEGYALASITVNGTAIEAVEGVYSFEMPAKEVTVAAVFTSTVALENIKAEGKAVKVVIDGQLYIKKGDKLFNALGTMLK